MATETTMTVRTSEKVANALSEYYNTKSAGAIRAVEGFVQLRRYTLHELKGVFTRKELIALVDAQNGLMQIPEYQANRGMFMAHCEDAEALDGTFTRHGADWAAVTLKIDQMTAAQVFFLQDEISLYWESQDLDLEKFVSKYL